MTRTEIPEITEIGVLHLGSRPAPEIGALARHVEELGYDALWIADEKFYRDPFISLALAAERTEHLRLGTGVTEPYARHPALIAMAMGTLAELCPGRCMLGLGAGGPGFPPMGVQRRQPTRALAEAVTIIRGLLAGERVTMEGQVLSFHGGALNFATAPMPIYVAARGRRMLQMAGRVADGVIMAPFASREALTYAIGLARAGIPAASQPAASQPAASQPAASQPAASQLPEEREAHQPRLVARVDVCIARTREAARRSVRYFVALPLWVSYPDWGYAEALGIALPEALRALIARRDYADIAAAADLLPDAMIDHFAVAGAEDDVAAQLSQIARLVDEIIIHPVASDDWGIDDVIDGVARIWRQEQWARE